MGGWLHQPAPGLRNGGRAWISTCNGIREPPRWSRQLLD
jgi:hypothetical protein